MSITTRTDERELPLAAELRELAGCVAAPAGAVARCLDASGAGDERPVTSEADALTLLQAWHAGERGFAAVCGGDTGIDVYRHVALAARHLSGRVPVRVKWGPRLGIKAAALALSFGADEL